MALQQSLRSTRTLVSHTVRCASTLPNDVFICSAARTPFGSFRKSLAPMSATELGIVAAKGAIAQANIKPEDVEDCYMGNVISAGLGQSPARQVALGAGCPDSTEATTLNKVCASGMKAVMMAAQNITLGVRDVMLAGGMESMSKAPYISRTLREGGGYGNQVFEDLILNDGLTDVYNKFHMGLCAEDTAEKMSITREESDAFAIESYKRSAAASAAGKFAKEIVPVEVPQGRKGTKVVDSDEEFLNFKEEKFPSLRPAFKKDGGVTAGNASTLNDGACCMVLASADAVERLGLTPLAKIKGFGDAARAPIEFPIAPALAIPVALKAAGLEVGDIARWEINEAFATVVIANQRLLNIDPALINPDGGAISLGHPIGASGARIVGTLVHQLEKGQLGCAAICNGGGAASAIILEKL
eukprot:m.167125 g.167125  ORF g.167125 m.167125 type:complete len:415 (+) comp14451_c0_seq1:342-1586(+)